MYFHIPTKVYIGSNVVTQHGAELASFGKKALIITGKTSAIESGALRDITNELQALHIDYHIFNEVTANPETHIVQRGSEQMKAQNCDFLIAIGGGSPIDTAKAISLQVANKLDISELYSTEKHKTGFPLVAIPTTAGTGSEVTQYSVLTDSHTKIKAGFGSEHAFPRLALCDAKYTLSCSETVTRDTAIDALSHLLEGIYSLKYNEFLLPFILQGIKLIYENLRECLQNPQDIRHREALLFASNYGGIVIAHTSTTLQHSIGYPLTSVFGTSHGLANGLVMKSIMNLYEPHLQGRLNPVFEYIKASKSQLFTWLDSLDMHFTGTIDDAFISVNLPAVMKSRNMALNPLTVSEAQIIDIYKGITET